MAGLFMVKSYITGRVGESASQYKNRGMQEGRGNVLVAFRRIHDALI